MRQVRLKGGRWSYGAALERWRSYPKVGQGSGSLLVGTFGPFGSAEASNSTLADPRFLIGSVSFR